MESTETKPLNKIDKTAQPTSQKNKPANINKSQKKIEKKMSQRNRISFVLTIFSLYYTLLSIHLSIPDLVYSDIPGFKNFLYSSVISGILFVFSSKGIVSRIYLINAPMFARFLVYFAELTSKYINMITEERTQ